MYFHVYYRIDLSLRKRHDPTKACQDEAHVGTPSLVVIGSVIALSMFLLLMSLLSLSPFGIIVATVVTVTFAVSVTVPVTVNVAVVSFAAAFC